MKSYIELGLMNSTDISFVSSDRPSTEQSSFPSFYNDFDGPRLSRSSNISDMTMEMMRMSPRMSIESDLAGNPYSPFTREGGTCTTSSSSPLAWNNNKKSNMVIIISLVDGNLVFCEVDLLNINLFRRIWKLR